jgi:RNA polymerase sigma-70 factor (ECF subfamily)
MVAVRMDPRMAARVDPSDVVQEALGDAARHLDDYLKGRPLPFDLWLRRLTWERLVEAQRRHILARRRSVNREEHQDSLLAETSASALADRLLASGTSPSGRLIRDEQRQRILDALAAFWPGGTAKSWCCATWRGSRRPRSPPCWGSPPGPS